MAHNMFYFIFDEPKQIVNITIENLSQFINLLNGDSRLFGQFYESFGSKSDDERDVLLDNNYKTYIANTENEIKSKYAKFLKRSNYKLKDELSRFKVYYRGVSDYSFLSVPSIYRGNNFKFEDKFINEIRVVNPDFVSGRTYIDELSALQHYGCPTRLLDLTNNPLVALYFACEEHRDSDGKPTDGAVQFFVAEEDTVLHSNSDKVLILTAVSHLSELYKKKLFEICSDEITRMGVNKAILKSNHACVKKLYSEITKVIPFEKEIKCIDLLQSFYIQPAFNNLRIRAQSGLFLINGLSETQKECASRNENKIFAKIKIPFKVKAKILSELDGIGINRRTLFPEIEDTVRYLKSIYK